MLYGSGSIGVAAPISFEDSPSCPTIVVSVAMPATFTELWSPFTTMPSKSNAHEADQRRTAQPYIERCRAGQGKLHVRHESGASVGSVLRPRGSRRNGSEVVVHPTELSSPPGPKSRKVAGPRSRKLVRHSADRETTGLRGGQCSRVPRSSTGTGTARSH
jgi:hypothetical protein